MIKPSLHRQTIGLFSDLPPDQYYAYFVGAQQRNPRRAYVPSRAVRNDGVKPFAVIRAIETSTPLRIFPSANPSESLVSVNL
jgi:hypothetical protein